MPPARVYLGLGSNLGDRAAHLAAAVGALGALPGTSVRQVSEHFETAPVGPIEQGPYLNAAAEIETALEPRPLLDALHGIERSRGRDRRAEERWGPRTLDLDILVYADRMLDEPGLTIPHPRLAERWFVLAPLAAIAPGLSPPGMSRTVGEMLDSLPSGRAGEQS